MKSGTPALPRPALALVLGLVALSAGCSYLRGTFSQTADTQTQDRIHAALPIGTPMAEAEAHLSGENFDCQTRQGTFIDERGNTRSAPRFLACVRRAGMVSFACENRDQVYVVPNNGVVDEVEVVRGPDCGNPPKAPTGGISNVPK